MLVEGFRKSSQTPPINQAPATSSPAVDATPASRTTSPGSFDVGSTPAKADRDFKPRSRPSRKARWSHKTVKATLAASDAQQCARAAPVNKVAAYLRARKLWLSYPRERDPEHAKALQQRRQVYREYDGASGIQIDEHLHSIEGFFKDSVEEMHKEREQLQANTL